MRTVLFALGKGLKGRSVQREISMKPLASLVPAELCAAVPARSLYVHVPFCRHRCGYCDFPLVAGRDHWIDDFLLALDHEAQRFGIAAPLETIFFGGGTPTQLSTDQLDRLFAVIDSRASRAANCEITVEANPNDLVHEKIQCLEANGVTRVSLGVQSFQPAKLKRLERTHDPAQAIEGVLQLLAKGLSVSVDLIFGICGDRASTWAADLQQAIELGVPHISTYHLTIEKGTAFWSRRQRGEQLEGEEDLGAELYELAIDKLTDAGFEHYEVSNFCRPGQACRHNNAYWMGQPYLGWGPGAASFNRGIRWKNHASVATYLRRLREGQSPIDSSERLPPERAARERLVFGLRRLEGIDGAAFEATTGFSVEQLGGERLMQWIAQGLFIADIGRIRLSRSGLMISDSLWPELL